MRKSCPRGSFNVPFSLNWGPVLLGVGCFLLVSQIVAQMAHGRVDEVSPEKGSPGVIVEITGQGLSSTRSVRFGLAEAAFEVISDQFLRAIVPVGATSGPITIQGESGFALSFDLFVVAPWIEGFEPEMGKPGDSIRLRGLNLSQATSLWLGPRELDFVKLADTLLEATLPADITSGFFRVESEAGWAESQASFRVIGPEPVVTGFHPSQAASGSMITIQGVQFNGVSDVWFADNQPARFSVVADTQIMVQVPEGAVSGRVQLSSVMGVAVSETPFLVLGSGPFADAVEPTQVSYDESLIISGIHLDQVSAVYIGPQLIPHTLVADTQIHATIPEGVTSGNLILQSIHRRADTEIFIEVVGNDPLVAQLEPPGGIPGDTLILTGKNLNAVQSVWCGNVEWGFESVASSQMNLTVPALTPGSYPMELRTSQGSVLSAVRVEVYDYQPIIRSFHPQVGQALTTVIIEGSGLNLVQEVMMAGRIASFEKVADTQIRMEVPPGATSSTIDLIHAGGTVATGSLFYFSPIMDSLQPIKARVGEEVTLLGRHFQGLEGLQWNDLVIHPIHQDGERILFIVPKEARSGDLTVVTPGGRVVSPQPLGVLPQLDAMEPVMGPAGTLVTLSGSGLGEVTALLLGELSLPFERTADGELQWVVPPLAASGVVSVVSPVGSSTAPQLFEVRDLADLSLEVTGPAEAVWRQPRTYLIQITNQGPSIAREVLVQHQLPQSIEYRPTLQPGVVTERLGNVIMDTILQLGPGQTLTIEHVLETPNYGLENHRFETISATFDPTPDDRQQDWLQVITGPIPALSIQTKGPKTVALSWDAALRGVSPRLMQSRGFGPEMDDWEPLDNSPFILLGDHYVLILEAPSSQTFFRLFFEGSEYLFSPSLP